MGNRLAVRWMQELQASPLALARQALLRPVIGVAALSLAANLLVFVPSLFMLNVYDRVLTSRNGTTLVMLLLIAAVLLAIYAALEHLRGKALVRASVLVDDIMAGPVFHATLQASLKARGPQHVQTVRDIDTVRDFVASGAIVTLIDAPWAPIFIAVCFLFHPWLGAVTLFGAVLLLVLSLLNERLTKGALIEASLHSIRALDRLTGSLRNAEAIQGLGMIEAIRSIWAAEHEKSLAKSTRASEMASLLQSAAKFLRNGLQIAILAVGAWLVIRQEITGGVMFAASLIMGRALAPLEQAVGHWKSLVMARSAVQRLKRFFAEAGADPVQRPGLPAPQGRIDLEDVTILAPGTRRALVRGASLSIPKGAVVAVVGKTGSGKSTLARALIGAWTPAAGAVRLDGNDLRHFDRDTLGRHFGYLPQDVELFEGSVRDNIARFSPDATDEAVVAAAMMAGAHDVIQRLDQGYATEIGEDGLGLSGGQRQRVGLARALFGHPAIVVLDEPNANLDGDGDAALSNAIRAMRARGTTVVIVTHKTGQLVLTDSILLMHEGQIVRYGPTAQMLPQILGPQGTTGEAQFLQTQTRSLETRHAAS